MQTNDFPLVYWEGVHKVMKSFPEMFRVWIMKQVSHFNGTNRMLSQYPVTETRKKMENRGCPNCRCFDESTLHITRCRDGGRTAVFMELVGLIVQWLRDQQRDSEVV
jgi:hypothetical protein